MIISRIKFVSILYIFLLLVIFIFQRNLLYVPAGKYHSPERFGLKNFEEVSIKTSDGLSLAAWYRDVESKNYTIIYLHGNASNLGWKAYLYKLLSNLEFGVLALEYRGYFGNPGSPSEEGLYEDARSAINFLVNEKNISSENIILIGRSLGTGVAIKMATEFDLHSLILFSPYDSIAEVAQLHYWYLPAKYMIKDRFDALSIAHKVEEQVFIFHGNDDDIIPITNGRNLYEAIKSQKEFIELQGKGHNDIDLKNILKDFFLKIFNK